ncbi:MAG TPA: T9SS type A sorting domain-containing protein [Chitinophagaceae bacterium]|nr:T9SS type A sorting domain-containing protein [Chitinophagaceae bacterium]
MKNLLLACTLLFSFINKSKAQFVTIPDSNFVTYLQSNFPSAMVGNQLDTTDPAIINCTTLSMTGISLVNPIQDMSGIEYFDNLLSLDCSYNLITYLPNLPSTLTHLDCRLNQLNYLSNLPNSLTYLMCNGNQLISLPNLPPSLVELNCDYNAITSFPLIPNSIQIISCNYNAITSFTNLPSSLITLNCIHNQLTNLPPLPNTLKTLVCIENNFTSLPTLSASILENLSCSYNQLSTIPTLPSTLKWLNCYDNLLTSLPILPNNLLYIACSNNLLSSLPSLPNSLTELHCGNCLLTSLPQLPSSLIFLDCAGNQLTQLPPLPVNLTGLQCPGNQLTSIPSLPPQLTSLVCSYNQLSYFNNFPPSLISLDTRNNPNLACLPHLYPMYLLNIDSTQIECLPNSVIVVDTTLSTAGIQSFPICDPASGCTFYWNVSGNVHQDSSVNCQLDSIQPGNSLSNVKVQLLKNNVVQDQMYVYNLGEFSFDTGIDDTLKVQLDTIGLPFTFSCPTPFYYDLIQTSTDSIKSNINFGIKCNGNDAGIQSIFGRFRPATLSHIQIRSGDIAKYYNMNCGTFGGTIEININGPVQYISPSFGALTPTSIIGNKITYQVADFSTITSNSFDIIVLTDTTAAIGSQVCVTAKVTNVINDVYPNNDSLEICFNIVNSFDPNDKQVSPKNAEAGDWLNYTIQFQNTGNDTAFLVVIQDTLSANLDIPSFTYLASSHHAITQVKSNIVTFTFPKINLLDSLNHEPESHGWVQYKIKLNSGLPDGTITNNKASIYFDFNPPIVTNIATNTVGPLSINNPLPFQPFVKIYPNPASNYFTIDHSLQGQVKAQLYSMEGRLIKSEVLTKNKEIFSLKNIATGIYLLEVSNDKREKVLEKIVIR